MPTASPHEKVKHDGLNTVAVYKSIAAEGNGDHSAEII